MAWFNTPLGQATLAALRPKNITQDVAGLTPTQFAELLNEYGLLSTSAGMLVTPETAAKCVPVAAACALVAGGIVSMPIRIVRRDLQDGRFVQSPADDNDLWWLLNESPNPDYASAVLWQRVAWDLKLRARSFVRIVREAGGRGIRPVELAHVPRSWVTVRRRWDQARGRLVTVGYQVDGDGGSYFVTPADMLDFRGEIAQNNVEQSAEFEAAKEAIGLALAIEQHCGRFFTNGGTPRTAIRYPQGVKLTQEQVDVLRSQWVRRYGGAENSHLPLVLSDGGQLDKVSTTAAEAQMIEQRKFQVIEIARAFRVPPFMIGETEKASSWGSGIEQMSKGFVRYTLGPVITSIEQELNRKLFGIARYAVDFDEEALDRGDMKSLGDWFRQAAGGSQGPGWMTVNEVRGRLKLPPIEGGDEIYDPKNSGGKADESTSGDGTVPGADGGESGDSAPVRDPDEG